jgi:hypothetical protein
VLMMGTLWKNNINFVKDLPTIHANSIINCNYSFWERKYETLLPYRPSYTELANSVLKERIRFVRKLKIRLY